MSQPKTKIQIGGHDVVVSRSSIKSAFKRFTMVNQDQLLAIANDKSLPIVMRVQNLIIGSSERDNFIDLTPTAVAQYLGCGKSAASKALKYWEQKGLLVVKPRTCMVSPVWAWKGSSEEHSAALRLVHG